MRYGMRSALYIEHRPPYLGHYYRAGSFSFNGFSQIKRASPSLVVRVKRSEIGKAHPRTRPGAVNLHATGDKYGVH